MTILTFAAVTTGLATVASGVTVGLIALLVRGLRAIDLDGEEPAWWPEFESQLAAYVARLDPR